MTPRVWIERPIESVEDAEALPEGTVAIQSWGHGTTARTLTNGRWITPSGSALPHAEVIGFTALVPVEAEEQVSKRWRLGDQPEGAEEFTLYLGDPLPDWIDAIPTQRRLCTPWEDL